MSKVRQEYHKSQPSTDATAVAVSLPGTQNMAGYWPAAWSMGNLARAGFPASSEGVWPYRYVRAAAARTGTADR